MQQPNLTSEERELLVQGSLQWGGPAHPSPALAVAMGFDDLPALHAEAQRIAVGLRDGTPLTDFDLGRALLMTEVAFASDVVGAGVEWETVTGLTDAESLRALRALQIKLVAFGAPLRSPT